MDYTTGINELARAKAAFDDLILAMPYMRETLQLWVNKTLPEVEIDTGQFNLKADTDAALIAQVVIALARAQADAVAASDTPAADTVEASPPQELMLSSTVPHQPVNLSEIVEEDFINVVHDAPEVVPLYPAPPAIDEPVANVTADPAPPAISEPVANVTVDPAPPAIGEPAANVIVDPAPPAISEPVANVTVDPTPPAIGEPVANVTADPAPPAIGEPADNITVHYEFNLAGQPLDSLLDDASSSGLLDADLEPEQHLSDATHMAIGAGLNVAVIGGIATGIYFGGHRGDDGDQGSSNSGSDDPAPVPPTATPTQAPAAATAPMPTPAPTPQLQPQPQPAGNYAASNNFGPAGVIIQVELAAAAGTAAQTSQQSFDDLSSSLPAILNAMADSLHEQIPRLLIHATNIRPLSASAGAMDQTTKVFVNLEIRDAQALTTLTRLTMSTIDDIILGLSAYCESDAAVVTTHLHLDYIGIDLIEGQTTPDFIDTGIGSVEQLQAGLVTTGTSATEWII